ncbi:DUF2851 family protein [Flavobacteriaceae bacterium M23B6Z8]
MKEDFLHYLWKYRKFDTTNLCTSSGEDIVIYSVGEHNDGAGPDFFNAKLLIGDQLWAGNVEIHLKSSHWYTHHHEKDVRYNNVILHVVWEHDIEIFRTDETTIPTLELKFFADISFHAAYTSFIQKKRSFVICENELEAVDEFLIALWKDRLFIERLEQKTTFLLKELNDCQNDWEMVLFKMLFKNFGLKANGENFYQISKSIDFQVVRKIRNDVEALESLLFGCAGLLEGGDESEYYREMLKRHFRYLKSKFTSIQISPFKPVFFRLRPANFPTIRLSQIAQLYHQHGALFMALMEANSVEEIYKIFNVGVSEYWRNHYTWGKKSVSNKKRLTKNFIDLLIINTIIPLKFCYEKKLGYDDQTNIISLISSIAPERNSIIEKFRKLGIPCKSAMESQSLLQLYNVYCQPKKCLDCAIGNQLLVKSNP